MSDDPTTYTVEDIMAMHLALQAERYAALHAAYGDDVNAMLMFPWTPPVPKEPPSTQPSI